MRPTTQKQASKRAEVAVRRHKALELKIAGHSDQAISLMLDVGVSTAHRDVKNLLEDLARKHLEEAANLRSLVTVYRRAMKFDEPVDVQHRGVNRSAGNR